MKKILLLFMLAITLVACSNTNTATKEENVNQATNSQETSSEKTIKVGIIQFAQHIALDRTREGFIEELENLGYKVEEETVNVNSDISLIPSTAKKFQADGVDIIYAIATPCAQGAKNAVQYIPIIFNAVTDPISAGLVESNEAPGANVTGVSDHYPIADQLDKFLEAFPEKKKLGVLYSTGETNSEAQIKELEAACKEKNIELVKAGVATVNDASSAISSLVTKIDSYVAIQDNLASSAASVISEKLNENKIPSFAGEVGPVENGILMADGIDYVDLGKSAADMADQIKNGKDPASIPVVFSKNTQLTVNAKTAKALGIDNIEELFKSANIIK